MSTCEVYSCKPGQKLKEGRLDYAPHIETKEQADADAKRRCQADPSLAKVAYYLVQEDGRFRMLHSYTNPNPGAAKPLRRPGMQTDFKPRAKTAKPPPPPSLLQRLARMLKPGGK